MEHPYLNESLMQDVRQGFETAYIDGSLASNLEYKPSFVSNNPKEGKKVISSIEDELMRCDHFQISVAFITYSGIEPLLMVLKELEKKGVCGEILTTNYLNFSEPLALERLHGLSNITIKMYDVNASNRGFHTKGYIFKKEQIYRIILGSSNLTKKALTVNAEWNTRIISTEHGEVAQEIVSEFSDLWNSAYALDYENFIEIYREQYEITKRQKQEAKKDAIVSKVKYDLKPNSMQAEFIINLRHIMEEGHKKALLISATGTGKTYASAFAIRELGFKRVLFIVHRAQLAKQAKESFERVFNESVSMGIVGAGKYEYNSDFVFAMIETLNKDEHLKEYARDEFDCIVLDEAHHSPANSYQKVMDYFTPQLFLGMTATPDRMDDNVDGRNVYEQFDRQIALDIRLQRALEENLLCTFHYFGITEIAALDDSISEKGKLSEQDFNRLTSDERVNHIIEQAQYYGYSGSRVKGLVFCGRNDECEALSASFNARGYRTVALSCHTDEDVRKNAFERLAMEEEDAKDGCTPLDYIFSVDILNEGIDIVEVNQVIMLRKTNSSIVFIQQLGRGLRKAPGKEFVVVLDFIGNYEKNFLIPVALSGDRTYNPDVIRKYVISGSSTIPGTSTVHFDEIAKERIFHAIDNIKTGTINKIIKDAYVNLKNRLGRRPMLLDFYDNGDIDPLVIINSYKTYYAFAEKMEKNESLFHLTEKERLTLDYLSKTIISGVRPDELEILRQFLEKGKISYDEIQQDFKMRFDRDISPRSIDIACDVLNGKFVRDENELNRYSQINIISVEAGGKLNGLMDYAEGFKHKDFYDQIRDIVNVGLARYNDKYTNSYSEDRPFVLYERYSRRDVCRLMGAEKDLSSTMYGMKRLGNDVFIFVTYHKQKSTDAEKIFVDGKPDYADEFVDNVTFRWDSKLGNPLGKAYMNDVMNAERKHLLVQKSDKESSFYYMGEFDVVDAYDDVKANNRGVLKKICKVKFRMNTAVREDLLKYLQSNVEEEAV